MGRDLEQLDRCGNDPSLDFANTVHSRTDPDAGDYLRSYDDLLRWAADGRLLTSAQRRRLRARADADPRGAARTFADGIALRETIHRIFSAVAAGRAPARADVEGLNGALQQALPHRRLRSTASGHVWTWDATDDLHSVLWPVALAAGDLLVDGDPERVRACPPPDGCGWLFLDTSKNGRRRWCDMRTCGSVVKARRYYRRKRAGTR